MAKLAFLGLGVMGGPMARHLAAKGHEVTVYNRNPAKAAAWVAKHGGASAATPRAAAEGAAFVMTCVGNDDDLRAVILGADGALAGLQPGAVLVDHTTASAARLTGQHAGDQAVALDEVVHGHHVRVLQRGDRALVQWAQIVEFVEDRDGDGQVYAIDARIDH